MAIKRCPYCRALIDEKEQYCNNCGTQLLFPEDGAVEEEIPGDKIIDADVEEKDYEIPEPGADKPVEDPEDDDEDEEEEEDEVRASADDGKPEEKTRMKRRTRGRRKWSSSRTQRATTPDSRNPRSPGPPRCR